MLSDFQINKTWQGMLDSEARALYFADLAHRYTLQKQWITGVSFFLATSAAATIIGKANPIVPMVLSLIVAAATAYSMAVNIDRKAATMAKLQLAWLQISREYSRLWNHTHDSDAENHLEKIIEMEAEPSELAATEAPNNQRLLGEWQE